VAARSSRSPWAYFGCDEATETSEGDEGGGGARWVAALGDDIGSREYASAAARDGLWDGPAGPDLAAWATSSEHRRRATRAVAALATAGQASPSAPPQREHERRGAPLAAAPLQQGGGEL
jgi:hypothetical protein